MNDNKSTNIEDNSRILVADDEKSIRQLFLTLLSYRFGKERLDIVTNGLEAVESFKAAHHRVIITDIHMPIKDGVQTYLEIEEICTNDNIAMPTFIFCTGFEPPEALKDITGPDSPHSLLLKPFFPDTLTEVINTALTAE